MNGKLTEIKDWLEIEIQKVLFGVRTLWLDFRTAGIDLKALIFTIFLGVMIGLVFTLMMKTVFG